MPDNTVLIGHVISSYEHHLTRYYSGRRSRSSRHRTICGATFLQIPELAWIADDQIISAAQHQAFAATGLSWLAQADEHPVGF